MCTTVEWHVSVLASSGHWSASVLWVLRQHLESKTRIINIIRREKFECRTAVGHTTKVSLLFDDSLPMIFFLRIVFGFLYFMLCQQFWYNSNTNTLQKISEYINFFLFSSVLIMPNFSECITGEKVGQLAGVGHRETIRWMARILKVGGDGEQLP